MHGIRHENNSVEINGGPHMPE